MDLSLVQVVQIDLVDIGQDGEVPTAGLVNASSRDRIHRPIENPSRQLG